MAKQHPGPRPKHVPERTCVVCRQKHDKRSLTRLVYYGNSLTIDPTGKLDGRGAYLCKDRTCWERAVKTNILDKALRAELSDEDRDRLQQAMP
ncbi:MAG: RNase P modulator RnpM [Phototrophicaceae bacterium]